MFETVYFINSGIFIWKYLILLVSSYIPTINLFLYLDMYPIIVSSNWFDLVTISIIFYVYF